MKDRFYLDYNATSPLSRSVIDFLGRGDFTFANPSGLHKSAKLARKVINESIESIFSVFSGIDKQHYSLIFHSGATEFINSFYTLSRPDEDAFIYFSTDHEATKQQSKKIFHSYELSPMETGLIEYALVEKVISKHKKKFQDAKIYLSFQWVNSESGVTQDIELLKQIKNGEYGHDIYIHVDAVQTPGKIKSWSKLSSYADAYTYSAHKFGALKSSGFSFVKRTFPLSPLLLGGGQQSGLRSGTENPLASRVMALALQDCLSYPFEEVLGLKAKIEKVIRENRQLKLVSNDLSCVNTIFFIDEGNRADANIIKFDMAGLDVSIGSACSSGSLDPSQTLIAMGYKDFSRNGIRISLGPDSIKASQAIVERIAKVISGL